MAETDTDISQLTEEQQQALQQFTSVTDQQLETALPLLRKCEWNVQIAIARFFDGEPPPSAAQDDEPADVPPPQSTRHHDTIANGFSQPRGSSSSSAAARRARLDPAPRVSSNPESSIARSPPLILSLLLAPANFIARIVARVFSLLSYLFPFLPRLLTRITMRPAHGSSSSSTPVRRPLGPQDTTLRFLREFEEEYGASTLPFLETGYARAFDLAKRDLKFLLTVPLAPEHDDTPAFVRSILLSQPVIDYLNDPTNNILLWAGTLQDSEPYQVAESLGLTKFPAAVVVALTPEVSSTAMSVIARIPAPAGTTPEDFLARIAAAVTQHTAQLDRARSARTEQEAARNLREQQNSAYERSLAQDRERARVRRETEAIAAAEEAAQKAAEEAAERHAENLKRWRRWRANKLPSETSADVTDAVRVSLRMPDGERVVRRFAPDVDIEDVYAVVECWEELKEFEENGVADEKEALPADFVHKYGFQLVSPMPREVYALADGGTVRQRIGRSGNLIVETLEENEMGDNDTDG